MRYYYITFRSVTHAQRGEKILGAAGVRCSLQRTPHWMEEQGCGYCLRLRRGEIESVIAMLREGNIQFRKVYRQGDDGNVEAL